MAGFTDAFPARDDPEGGHPLRRSTRREMQQAHRFIDVKVLAHAPDSEPGVLAEGYGLGLFVTADPALGTVVSHAGGYPGFGSHMAWHPATGLGVIGLGNIRYAPVRPVVTEALAMLVRAEAAPRRRVVPSAAVERFRGVVELLLARWDDARGGRGVRHEHGPRQPRDLRRATAERLSAEIGPFRRDPSRPDRSSSPAHLAWWLRGERGWVRAEILVTPEPEPLIQRLALTAVGDPSAALRDAAESLLRCAAEPAPVWPADVPAGRGWTPGPSCGHCGQPRRASGRCASASPTAGDGSTSATWELDTDRGRAQLGVGLDRDTGSLVTAELASGSSGRPPSPGRRAPGNGLG